jgi:hypothetical protein
MTGKSGIDFMMAYVKGYLAGETERMWFDLDFNYYLMEHYPKMERKNSDMAECFYFYLAEQGFDQAGDLPDSEHKKLIRRQFNKFKAAMRDGFL